MGVVGSIQFKLKGFMSENCGHTGFTNLYATLVANVPKNVAQEIISMDENFKTTLQTNIAKAQVSFIKNDPNLFKKMIKEIIEIDGDSQEEAIEKILDWEFWKDQIDFELVDFIQEK